MAELSDVSDFFAWVEAHRIRLAATLGLLASAFGYAFRQRDALRRLLDDGRLPMTNNASERALRGIAVGRKAWLFFGSDDHAQAAPRSGYAHRLARSQKPEAMNLNTAGGTASSAKPRSREARPHRSGNA